MYMRQSTPPPVSRHAATSRARQRAAARHGRARRPRRVLVWMPGRRVYISYTYIHIYNSSYIYVGALVASDARTLDPAPAGDTLCAHARARREGARVRMHITYCARTSLVTLVEGTLRDGRRRGGRGAQGGGGGAEGW